MRPDYVHLAREAEALLNMHILPQSFDVQSHAENVCFLQVHSVAARQGRSKVWGEAVQITAKIAPSNSSFGVLIAELRPPECVATFESPT